MSEPIKQVIVIRKDLHMRKGKFVAQACHGEFNLLLSSIIDMSKFMSDDDLNQSDIQITNLYLYREWMKSDYRKVCVYCERAEELLSIYYMAKQSNILVNLVKDNGLTEFNNIPTHTACIIGPDYDSKLDPLTGHLNLL